EFPTARSAGQWKMLEPSAFSGICCTNVTLGEHNVLHHTASSPTFAPIFNVVGANSGIVHAGLLHKREVGRGVPGGLGPSLAAGRTIARRPTSRRGHRQYLQLGP